MIYIVREVGRDGLEFNEDDEIGDNDDGTTILGQHWLGDGAAPTVVGMSDKMHNGANNTFDQA